MRTMTLTLLFLLVWGTSRAQGYDVLVLQSHRDSGSEVSLKGFRAAGPFSARVLVLSDYNEIDVVRIVREDRPLAVLAVGSRAFEATRKLARTPVVAILSPFVHRRGNDPNVGGVEAIGPPGDYIKQFQKLGRRRIGVVFDPANSGWYLRQARQAANDAGIRIISREVSNSRDTIAQLSSLSGEVDALWMLPDATVVTNVTTEAWLRLAQKENIPVFSFTSLHLDLGASLVMEIDRFELGKQAGTMISAVLSGDGGGLHIAFPKVTRVKINSSVLRRLGLTP